MPIRYFTYKIGNGDWRLRFFDESLPEEKRWMKFKSELAEEYGCHRREVELWSFRDFDSLKGDPEEKEALRKLAQSKLLEQILNCVLEEGLCHRRSS